MREVRGGITECVQTIILIDQMSRREGEGSDDEVEDKEVGGCRCGCLSPRPAGTNTPYPRAHQVPSRGA